MKIATDWSFEMFPKHEWRGNVVGRATRGSYVTDVHLSKRKNRCYLKAPNGKPEFVYPEGFGRRPNAKKMENGGRHNIYISNELWKAAKKVGDGNASRGIQRLLKHWSQLPAGQRSALQKEAAALLDSEKNG